MGSLQKAGFADCRKCSTQRQLVGLPCNYFGFDQLLLWLSRLMVDRKGIYKFFRSNSG